MTTLPVISFVSTCVVNDVNNWSFLISFSLCVTKLMLVCLCWEIVLLKIFNQYICFQTECLNLIVFKAFLDQVWWKMISIVQHFVRVHVSHVYALFCQREVNKVALNEVWLQNFQKCLCNFSMAYKGMWENRIVSSLTYRDWYNYLHSMPANFWNLEFEMKVNLGTDCFVLVFPLSFLCFKKSR